MQLWKKCNCDLLKQNELKLIKRESQQQQQLNNNSFSSDEFVSNGSEFGETVTSNKLFEKINEKQILLNCLN